MNAAVIQYHYKHLGQKVNHSIVIRVKVNKNNKNLVFI